MIRTFEISEPEEKLTDLKNRIRNARWPDSLKDSGWEYGPGLDFMKELTDYWINEFDWRKTEISLNTYPNFTATIDGYAIHFLHIKGSTANSLPLIITHGWPYSVLEMMKLIPILGSFDLVIPSMLGYGYSQKVAHPGCNSFLMADLWHKLMFQLGYTRYGVQGGDFGAGISAVMAYRYPESVTGMHLNYIPGFYEPVLSDDEEFSAEETVYLKSEEDWYTREGGYSHQQRTRPLTLSYALNDSPVGLCAWIVEKMHCWADNTRNTAFSKDELLSNVTLYWLTETIHSSVRLYNENSKVKLRVGSADKIRVPAAIARFRYEEPFPPGRFIERGFTVKRWNEFPAGGHFPAMEQPQLLANDIIEFFKSI